MEADRWKGFAENYDERVFSLTKIPRRREQVLEKVQKGKVLNMGCGSAPYLNRDLITQGNHVTATDFCHKMLQVSRRQFNHPNLEFMLADSKHLPFDSDTFDTVISVNSILPEKRSDAYRMVNEAYRVLKKEGVFIAFLCSFDSAMKSVERLGLDSELLDHEHKRVRDTVSWQCFHTPELIKDMMEKTGFQKYEYWKVFLKTKMEISELNRLYSIDTSKCFVYEYFLAAEKH